MLINLHVKNLALIKEADIYFDEGLNILSGETGAGKSILLGSINLALGSKSSKGMIGKYGDYASVELLFQVDDECALRLSEYDVNVLDNQVLISRRFTESKSIMKINGESATLGMVKKITPFLIDIHGQHEHQSLLYPANHLTILDRFSTGDIFEVKGRIGSLYSEFQECQRLLNEFTMDDDERLRNMDFLSFEVNEIEEAGLKPGEDEQLEAAYRRGVNARKIASALSQVRSYISDSASEMVGNAIRSVGEAARYDDGLDGLVSQLSDIESLINDFSRDLSDYFDGLEYDRESFSKVEERLDTVNNLKAKHGGSIEAVLASLDEKRKKLEFLSEYESNRRQIINKKDEIYDKLLSECGELTRLRTRNAASLEKRITESLNSLNFLSVNFKISITPCGEPTRNGMDCVEFLISLNPGEQVQSLANVASGGELSRIMLAIKTALADKDDIDTLIFDEIDTGISGRTAKLVADKLMQISKSRQVICITHLPQIASMADKHFCITKNVVDDKTLTQIKELSRKESIMELARMLGGDEVSQAAFANAGELKDNADALKQKP